jgi:hypothetical protein
MERATAYRAPRASRKVWATPLQVLLIAERLAALTGRDEDFLLGITDGYTGTRWGEAIGLMPDYVLRGYLHGDALRQAEARRRAPGEARRERERQRKREVGDDDFQDGYPPASPGGIHGGERSGAVPGLCQIHESGFSAPRASRSHLFPAVSVNQMLTA